MTLGGCSEASAQSSPCKTIADDKERLACYDKAAEASTEQNSGPIEKTPNAADAELSTLTSAELDLQSRLDDPSSFESLHSRLVDDGRGGSTICITYRARNQFNALRIYTAAAWNIKPYQFVVGASQLWKKFCKN
jgi:hypothetical protein